MAVCPALMVTLAGEAERSKSMPVPLRLTVCGLPPKALSLTLSVPVRLPAATGLKVTLMEQLAPAANVDEQLLV